MSVHRPVSPSGKWFEDFAAGMVVQHSVTRSVTESDNILFSCMTMNPQPLHLNLEYGRESDFGQPLVNSMFTLSLLVGMSVYELTLGTTIANLGFERIAFPHPVFVGDTIWAETEIVSKRASRSRPAAGIVVFEHRALNQHDTLVAQCRRTALMHRRPVEPLA